MKTPMVTIKPPKRADDCRAQSGYGTSITTPNGNEVPGVLSATISIEPRSAITATIETRASFDEISAVFAVGKDTLTRWADEAGFKLVERGRDMNNAELINMLAQFATEHTGDPDYAIDALITSAVMLAIEQGHDVRDLQSSIAECYAMMSAAYDGGELN